jgi:hypothetical protein
VTVGSIVAAIVGPVTRRFLQNTLYTLDDNLQLLENE